MTAKKQPPLTDHRCGICGTRLRAERWVYSRFTGSRYCIGTTECKARAKRKGKT